MARYYGRLNPDIERRDTIIFGEYNPKAYGGGIRQFKDMSLDTLIQLVDEGFARVNETQNESPTIGEFIDFASDYDGAYTFGGYVVSDTRKDYRVTVDTIWRAGAIEDQNELLDFEDFAGGADEFDESGYAWWD